MDPRRGPRDVAALEEGLEHFITKMTEAGFNDAAALAGHEGAGSAGGIGYACLLLGAKQPSGADFFLDLLDFQHPQGPLRRGHHRGRRTDPRRKLPAAVARRSGTRPIIAVAGRSLLSPERWSEMAVTRVYTLADYTDQDSSKDPGLSAALLRRIGKDIGSSLL